MPWWRRIAAVLCFATSLGWAWRATADIVILKDGAVLIGSLLDASGERLKYESFGKTREVDAGAVIETKKDIASIAGKPINVVLTDGSVFTGSVSEYDPEIGLFLDLSIGTLTIPSSGIAEVVDVGQRRRWVGSDLSLRTSAYCVLPLGGGDFGASFAAGISADARLPVRGLTAGIAAEWCPLNYEASTEVAYSLLSAIGRVGYRYLGWANSGNFLSRVSPFASIGAGGTYIGVKDSRPGASSPSTGGAAPRLAAEAGADISISRAWSARLSCRPDLVLQADGIFATVALGISLSWENDL
jgi:small nuclear ribonucleoprotein (snRNP)-like protein